MTPDHICKACQYRNDGTRLFCHNCGAKLDLDDVALQRTAELPAPAKPNRPRRKRRPEEGVLFRAPRTLVRTVVLAALVAAAVNIARPPAHLPAPEPPDNRLMQKLGGAAAGAEVALSQAEINAWLAQADFKDFRALSPWVNAYLSPQRLFASVGAGESGLTAEFSLAGRPFYIGLCGRLSADENGLQTECVGGAIGRLRLPAPVAQYGMRLLPKLLASFADKAPDLKRIAAVKSEPGAVTVTVRPSGKP